MESCLNTQNKTQVDRFKEAARQLEANDDEAVFNAKLGNLVKRKLTKDPESESMPPDSSES